MDKLGVEKRGNHKRADTVTDGDEPDAERYRSEEWLRTQYVEQNKSVVEMAEQAGVTPTTICNWMDAAGVEIRDPHQRDHIVSANASDKLADESWLRDKYVEERLSTPEIAERVGRTQAAVAYWMKKHGVEWRDSKEAAPRGEEHPDWDGGHTLEYGGEWQERREEAIQRDGEACRRCGTTREEARDKTGRDLHVHHIQKLKEFDDPSNGHELDNLLTVCQSCHAKIEGLPIDAR
jgi:5-methylcytosine-specific restriction endonuclease McrA